MKEVKQFVEYHLPKMSNIENVYKLFEGLGYKILDPSYHGIESWGLQKKDKELINNIFTIANYQRRFQIFLVELKKQSNTIIRNLPLYFEKEVQYPFFVITDDYKNYTFVFVEKIREDVGAWKRKIVKLNVDITNAYHTDKLTIANIAIDGEITDPKQIYNNIKEAFSVEKVSNLFFNDYKRIFFRIRENLTKQNINIKQAHDFSQQLLNRIMFIYFIDKKGWLKYSPKFFKWFWNRYLEVKDAGKNNLNFYDFWVKPLFFKAFNNTFSYSEYIPEDVQEVLKSAPYLNGGLFKQYDFDNIKIELSDDIFEEILNFFEKYNFTIREDLPLDVEVAIDPQMIGYVYESLANVAEEIYERQDLGIFYTPKEEVDFMCRRSLVEYLFKATKIDKEIIYKLLFSEDKKEIEDILKINEYEKLELALDELAVLDPACGSGAFLVGMLNVLVEIYKIIFQHLHRDMKDYDLKKRIIGNNIYGVDVMPWAVHSAELRLWLSLMIESDLKIEDLKRYPLLPNLNLKLRIGDSLVQEIGGINLNIRDIDLSPSMKNKLVNLKREKERYYNNDPTGKFKSQESVLEEEIRIFKEILDEIIEKLEEKKQKLLKPKPEQGEMFQTEPIQEEIFNEKQLKEKIESNKKRIDEQIEQLIKIKNNLEEQKPFVWEIDFAEIFGEKGGFDIVIGNPPYVRQEKIAPPNMLQREITNELKKEYKEKLIRSVKTQFKSITKIDKKSDYYIYFYFHGLSLLNKRGTFCFITSNSWLDVGYGKDLQEFLLKYVPIIAIYDNQVKRSFEHADINTVIALFGVPYRNIKSFPGLKNIAKFVMFKKPFDEAIDVENLIKIEKAETTLNTNCFRVFPKRQMDLLIEGWEWPKDIPHEYRKSFSFNIGKYTGNKWGGKYLRAPDIFFTILEKGKDKLVRLGDIAEVRFGIKTGCNEFFYLPSKHFDIKKEGKYYRLIPKHDGLPDDLMIEEEYLKPVITSPRECTSVCVDKNKLKKRAVIFNKEDKNLKDTYLIRYILWGEKKGFNKITTCTSRRLWWDLGERIYAEVLWPMIHNDRPSAFLSEPDIVVDHNLFEILHDKKYIMWLNLQSTFLLLVRELYGRSNLGEGALKTEGIDIKKFPILRCELFSTKEELYIKKIATNLRQREILSCFEEFGINRKQPIRSQKPNPLPDRKALDDIVFDAIGLTQDERNEVYWSVCELVKNRLEKARSI